jgi:hypothetical protein
MSHASEGFKAAMMAHLGHAPDHVEPGKLMRFPTNQRRGDTAGYCKLWPDERGGFYGDFRTGKAGNWSAVERDRMNPSDRLRYERQLAEARAERDAMQRVRWAGNRERMHALWDAAHTVAPADPVALYLMRRGLGGVWPLPICLRCHPALSYWHEGAAIGTYPAMLAAFQDASGEVVGIHQTFLTSVGCKADVPSVKKMAPTAGLLVGGSIALAEPANGVIGIAEGIETALAARLGSGIPAVAAYSAACLAAYQWPADVNRLVVLADHDANGTGQAAAHKLQRRAQAAGVAVQVMTPTTPGADWADVYAHHVTEVHE